jgi:hypothetical protein
MMNRKTDLAELFWSVLPMLLFAVLVAVLIMAAPSIDTVIWGR